MQVPLLDLKAQYGSMKEEIDRAVSEVISQQQFVLGNKVKALEEAIATYSQVQHAVGVASGSDALLLSLMAAGIGPGDEVITAPFTFFATGGSISRVGARPSFVDIDPTTYNIDPTQIAEEINEKTKAIIPVHLFGQCADMDPIEALAKENELWLIEDAAQAIGAEYGKNSVRRRAGSMGDFGCFSFYPSKNLGGYGDGGMVTTNDDSLAERIRLLRVHGASAKYRHKLIGVNSRLDSLQAAILLAKLRHLDEWTEKRQKNATYYNQLFNEMNSTSPIVIVPHVQYGNRHIYNQYVIRVPRRDALRDFLSREGIGTDIYYPLPLHLQECYKNLGYSEGAFPHSERAAKETLAIPIYPELTLAQQEYVVSKIQQFFSSVGT